MISAPPRTDTAGARYADALVIELRDSAGAVRPGIAVTVTVRRAPDGVIPVVLDAGVFGRFDSAEVTTDARGRASIPVVNTRSAGVGVVRLRAPAFGVADSVEFTVLPGAAAGVAVRPADTAVVRGQSVRIRAIVVDAYGNARPDLATLAAAGPLTVAAESVTGTDYGVGQLTGAFGAWKATGRVAVVPAGLLAFGLGGNPFAAIVVRTDGSGYRTLGDLGWPSGWAPTRDGATLVVAGAPQGSSTGPFRLSTLSVAPGNEAPPGGPIRVVPVPLASGTWTGSQTGPAWSGGAGTPAWIYFTQASDGLTPRGQIWRVHPDGSGLAPVVAHAQGAVPPSWFSPSASPDGGRLAYLDGSGALYVQDLGSGVVRSLGAFGAQFARWSPAAERIAIWGTQGLLVVAADGSGMTRLAAAAPGQGPCDWSPDGRWLVWKSGTGIALVDPNTGQVVTLAFGPFLQAFQPAWTSP